MISGDNCMCEIKIMCTNVLYELWSCFVVGDVMCGLKMVHILPTWKIQLFPFTQGGTVSFAALWGSLNVPPAICPHRGGLLSQAKLQSTMHPIKIFNPFSIFQIDVHQIIPHRWECIYLFKTSEEEYQQTRLANYRVNFFLLINCY